MICCRIKGFNFLLSPFCLHFRFFHEFKINRPVIAGSWGLSLSVFVSINLPLQFFLSCHMPHAPLLSLTHTEHLRQMRWTIGWAHNVCTIRHFIVTRLLTGLSTITSFNFFFLAFCFASVLCCDYSDFFLSFSFITLCSCNLVSCVGAAFLRSNHAFWYSLSILMTKA